MENKTRRPSHWTILARKARSPHLQGISRRSLRAARLAQEERDARRAAATPQSPALSASRAFPTLKGSRDRARRRTLAVVIAVSLLPLSLLTSIAVIALSTLHHLDTTTSRVQAPCVACALARNPDTGGGGGASPTAAPFTLPGFGAPASTDVPLPTLTSMQPFTVLLLGVDSREGDTDPAHSDTIILAYVDPAEKHVNLLSIPRDLRVIQAGSRGMAKMSDVYANGDATNYRGVGGVGLVWDTIKLNFQINIDYFAAVNFGGLTQMVDAVGGVTVDNPYPIKDDEYPTPDYQYTRVYFPAGIMHLNGAEALEYARTRHGDNDFARNTRQQQVILALRAQAVRQNLVAKTPDILDALGSSFRTDLPQNQWLPLASFGKDLGNNGITQLTLADLLYDDPQGGIYYAGIDWTKARERAVQFSPKENLAAVSAQAQQGANTAAPITVENGTQNGGLAKRWSDTLTRLGYTQVRDPVDAPVGVKGKVAQTRVLCFGANTETARAITKTLGLPASAVDTTSKRPPEAPPDTAIVVLLGDDAHEPDANVPSGTG